MLPIWSKQHYVTWQAIAPNTVLSDGMYRKSSVISLQSILGVYTRDMYK